MYKQFLKSILLATVATFSLSTVVNAKPIPKNATYDQILKGIKAHIYSSKDMEAAIKQEQPNVMGLVSYFDLMAYMDDKNNKFSLEKSYYYAKKATAKNDTLGKFVLGQIYDNGYRQENGLGQTESQLKGEELLNQACLKERLSKKFALLEVPLMCTAVEIRYKRTK